MALEEISKAVLESVQREAELIIKSAKKEAEEKKKNAQRNAEEKAERLYQLAIRNIDEEMAREEHYYKSGIPEGKGISFKVFWTGIPAIDGKIVNPFHSKGQ